MAFLALQDLYSFRSFALLLQLALFIANAARAARHPDSTAFVVQRAADVLISAVPIAIPTLIIFTLISCTLKLLRLGISAHEPVKVKLAADVEVGVSDNTGTPTSDMVSVIQLLTTVLAHQGLWLRPYSIM